MMNNARHSCITAAAGTCISHDFFSAQYHYFCKCTSFTTAIVFFTYANSLGHAFAHCLKFFTAAKGRVVFIPYVVDSSLKSTMDYRLSPPQYLIPYNNVITRKYTKLKLFTYYNICVYTHTHYIKVFM